jgi:crotonobetainyl-CoA:carnitine CoA-transferase CaiB-like acyl-CoA transferase
MGLSDRGRPRWPPGSATRNMTAPSGSGVVPVPRGAAPELGQHTEEILLETGLDWDEISELRESGALG